MSVFNTNYTHYSDEELIKLIVGKNNAAFDELYNRYSTKMLHYFYRMLNQDAEKAQDFLQDLFIKVIEKATAFDTKKKFSTWLYTIANNMCKNEYRSMNVRKSVSVETQWESKLTIAHQNNENVDGKLFQQYLHSALNKLSENHKTVFILRYQQELSIKEISETMNCSEGTVKSRLFYALKKLSDDLKVFNPVNA